LVAKKIPSELSYQAKLVKSKNDLEKTIVSSTNELSKILLSIEAFKSRYQIDNPRNSGRNRNTADMSEIVLRLLSLLDINTSAEQAFDNIDSFLTVEDDDSEHIKALKLVLRKIYDGGYIENNLCRDAFNLFLHNTLKTSMTDFLSDTNTVNN
jgi:hypothetical protein